MNSAYRCIIHNFKEKKPITAYKANKAPAAKATAPAANCLLPPATKVVVMLALVVGQEPEQEVMVTRAELVTALVMVEVVLVPFGAAATEAAAAAKIARVENCIVLGINERLGLMIGKKISSKG